MDKSSGSAPGSHPPHEREVLERELLSAIKNRRDGLVQLLDKVSGHWSYEDPVAVEFAIWFHDVVYDAGKKVVGRKRHVLVDTLGFLLGISVTEASVQDRGEARDLLRHILVGGFGWLKRIWADGGYSGKLVEEIASLPRHCGVELEIVKRINPLDLVSIRPYRSTRA
jgi:hypothetical protein